MPRPQVNFPHQDESIDEWAHREMNNNLIKDLNELIYGEIE